MATSSQAQFSSSAVSRGCGRRAVSACDPLMAYLPPGSSGRLLATATAALADAGNQAPAVAQVEDTGWHVVAVIVIPVDIEGQVRHSP